MAKEPQAQVGRPGVTEDQQQRGMISADGLGKLLEISPPTLAKLVREGYITKSDEGRYTIVGGVQGYIRYLKAEERRSSKSASASAVQMARAREIDLRVARDTNKIVDTEEAATAIDDIVGLLKTEFAGLAAEVTRDVEQRDRIESVISRCWAKASARIAQHLASLRASGSAIEASEGDES